MAKLFYLAPTANYVQKALNGSINSTQTTITLNNTTNMSSPGYIVVDRVNSSGVATPNAREVISYTGISSNDITGCVRGEDGSTAASHNDTAIVETIHTIGMWNSLTTIVSAGFTQDGYLKAISSPVSIGRLETPFIKASSALLSIVTLSGHLNASGASLVGLFPSGASGALLQSVGNAAVPVFINTSLSDGWTSSPDTWTFATASTFTIAGVDRTAVYTKGTKLKFTNSGAKFAVVVSSAFGTDTTVTIVVNTDYTIANAAITAAQYSYSTPPDFPTWFNYTPTGVSASNVTLTARYNIIDRICFVRLKVLFAGAITFTTMPTLPTTASGSIVGEAVGISGVGGYLDAGTVNVQYGIAPSVIASATTVRIVRATDSADISATVPITWANNDVITLDFRYEI